MPDPMYESSASSENIDEKLTIIPKKYVIPRLQGL